MVSGVGGQAIWCIQVLPGYPTPPLNRAPDGMVVYACSFDGTVAVIQLDDAELGKPLSADEQVGRYEV